jgi:hypothetical protein
MMLRIPGIRRDGRAVWILSQGLAEACRVSPYHTPFRWMAIKL